MCGAMFLRHTKRKKDGKEHRYWSIVENRRVGGGRVVQRPLLYLGEINDSQELAWRGSIEVMEAGTTTPRTLSLFPEDRCEGVMADASIVNEAKSAVARPEERKCLGFSISTDGSERRIAPKALDNPAEAQRAAAA